MYVSTESTLKYIFWLNFNSFWALADFVPYLSTVVTNVVLKFDFRKLLEQHFGTLEVIFDKYFGMEVCTSGSFFTVSIHVVPAKFMNNMSKPTVFSLETKSHLKIGATFVDMFVRAMNASFAFLSHEIWANFEVMTKVTLISIATLT